MPEQAKLQTKDGVVEVDKEVACVSTLLRNTIEDNGVEDDIPVPSVSKAILEKVMEYATHILENGQPVIEKPLRADKKFSEVVNSEFYLKYVEVDVTTLSEIILAANYLDIQSLLELASAKMASLIKDMSVEEMRAFFGEADDLSAEDKAIITKENQFAEESF